jgi:PPOX class probable F420-dependent enzyme
MRGHSAVPVSLVAGPARASAQARRSPPEAQRLCPHQNTWVAGEPGPARWQAFGKPSCGASAARSSICACLACNTGAGLRATCTPIAVPRLAVENRLRKYWAEPGKSAIIAEKSAYPDALSVQCGMPIPPEIRGRKYISLTTFRKSGAAVATPVWFGEEDGKLYVMSRRDSGKCKRLRNNPTVRVAPCTIRGKVTGPEFPGQARILPKGDFPRARQAVRRKYWLARVPFLWSKDNVYLEIMVGSESAPTGSRSLSTDGGTRT